VFFQFVKQISPNYTFGANPGLFNFYFEGSSLSGNQPTYVLNNWQKNGDQGSFQKYSANYPAKVNIPYALASLSNLAYSDGSYIRLKNVSLSWQLPEPVKNKLHLKNARIYLQGQNILTITNFKGLDPESPGVANLPPLRVITAGIQVGL
jgi:hypothetical protein